jgi:hypothetical protein
VATLFVITNKNVTPGAVAQRRPRQQSEDFRRGDESFEREVEFAFEQRKRRRCSYRRSQTRAYCHEAAAAAAAATSRKFCTRHVRRQGKALFIGGRSGFCPTDKLAQKRLSQGYLLTFSSLFLYLQFYNRHF